MWIRFGIKSYLRSCDLATKMCFLLNICKSFFLMVAIFLASCILTVPEAARFALLDCRLFVVIVVPTSCLLELPHSVLNQASGSRLKKTYLYVI